MMLPCILAEISEDELLAKPVWITVIIRMPGPMNSTKGRPITSPRPRPSATTNTTTNSPAVISGASTVCCHTDMKRRISRSASVAVPSQLMRPKRRSGIWP